MLIQILDYIRNSELAYDSVVDEMPDTVKMEIKELAKKTETDELTSNLEEAIHNY